MRFRDYWKPLHWSCELNNLKKTEHILSHNIQSWHWVDYVYCKTLRGFAKAWDVRKSLWKSRERNLSNRIERFRVHQRVQFWFSLTNIIVTYIQITHAVFTPPANYSYIFSLLQTIQVQSNKQYPTANYQSSRVFYAIFLPESSYVHLLTRKFLRSSTMHTN